MQSWLMSLSGQGKTADLGGATCIVGSGNLQLGGLRSLTLRNGTLRFTRFLDTPAIVLNSNPQDLVFSGLTLIGASPTPGKSAGESSEHNAAFDLQGVQRITITGNTIRGFGGDCAYAGGFATVTWTHGLTFTNNVCTDMGRMGVAAADGLSDAVIRGNTFDRFGWYATLDVEPNGVCVGNPCIAPRYEAIDFSGNQIGRGNSAKLTFVLSHASCCGSFPPVFGTITVTGNRTMYPDTPWSYSVYPAWQTALVMSDNR